MTVSFKPHLWYVDQAEEAARFYASVIPNSSIDRVTRLPAETPSGPPGAVTIVEFTLAGAPMMAMSAGPHHPFNDAISLMLICDTQDEIDTIWNGLLAGGGSPVQCGWLKDRFGVSWQVTPRCIGEMIADPDRQKATRVTQALMAMIKIDIATLKAA